MQRLLLVLTVGLIMAAMVAVMAVPAVAASQKGCFAAQRSADASGRSGLTNPPFPNEGTFLSTRHAANSIAVEPHKCF